MKIASGTFNGTGAALYICVGFIPNEVYIQNFETSNDYTLWWADFMRAAEFTSGKQEHTGTTYRQWTAQTATAGIEPYEGGDVLTTSNQTSVTYGEGVYLARFNQDVRISNAASVNPGDGSGATIDTWTLGNAGNRTGNWNADCVGTYIGEGSRIKIDGKWYNIEAVTAGQGISANEVTLSRAAASGTVEFIEGMYSYAPLAIGKITPAGFVIKNTTVNADAAYCGFKAIQYED